MFDRAAKPVLRFAFFAVAVIALSLAAADPAGAKDKDKPGKGKANKVQLDGNQGAKKQIPPGQIKRYTRGSSLPKGGNVVRINDLSKYKLPKLKAGQSYVRVGNEIVKISDDSQTVIEAIGIVDDWLK